MRNMLALVGLAVVGFAGGGWYLGWYTFAVQPGKDGKQHIAVDVDTKKIADDGRRGLDKVGQVVDEFRKPAAGTTADTKKNEFVGPPRLEDMPKFEDLPKFPGKR